MSTQGQERRRDYMVNRRVQFLYLAIWGLSVLLVVGFALFAYLLSNSQPTQEPSAYIYFYLGGVAFLIIACALSLGVYTIIHTHRMMGSAYRIGQYLREMNQGGAKNPLTLRDKDYFQEVADEVNALRDMLGQLENERIAAKSSVAPPPPAPEKAPDPKADAKEPDAKNADAKKDDGDADEAKKPEAAATGEDAKA